MSTPSAGALPARPALRLCALIGIALALLCLAPAPAPLAAAGAATSQVFLPQVNSFHPPRLSFIRSDQLGITRYAIAADGSGLTCLLGPDQPTPFQSYWSPDGKRLAMLELFTIGGIPHRSIWVLDLSTLTRKRLTDDTFNVYDLDWSPDSRHLSFLAWTGPTATTPNNIYTIDVDGAGLTRLTSDGALKLGPTWSPDGRQIAFMTVSTAGVSLQTTGADGAGRRTLIEGQSVQTFYLAWSPDSQSLAYLSETGSPAATALYRIRLDGSGLRRVAENLVLMPTSWSPDGRWLLAERIVTGGLTELVAFGVEDGTARVLIPPDPLLSWSIGSPTWSPDGSVIAFSYLKMNGGTFVAVVGADGKGFRELAQGDMPVWLP